MPRYRDFAPTNRLPATWTDAIEELVGNYLDPNFRLERPTATTLQVPAGAGDLEISVAIDGKPRYNVANVVANHPGGIAGSYPIHITGNADSFATGVDGYEVNNTVTTFGLKIGAPSGVGAEAISRQVGTLTWDGAAITGVQLDRNSFDAYARFIWGGDTNLYRATANLLKTDDSLHVVGDLATGVGDAARQVQITSFQGLYPALVFGTAADTNLYRSAANTLRTDGKLIVGAGLDVLGDNVHIQSAFGSGGLYIGPTTATRIYSPSAGVAAITSKLIIGTNAPVSSALVSVVDNTNGLEFGHSNAAGFRSTLGAQSTNGVPFLAFNGEAGTTTNTYRTRGLRASILRSDLAGGFDFGNVATASADNQAFVSLLTMDSAGTIRHPAGVFYASPSGIRTLNSLGNLHLDGRRDDATAATGGIYLNWNFPGSVIFGNGAAGQVAAMSSAGDLSLVGALTVGATALPVVACVETVRILRGTIDIDGTVLRGTGFTASRTAAGTYTITWTTAFSAKPSMTVTQVGAYGFESVTPELANAQIVTTSTNPGVPTDRQFMFIAVGPR